MRILIIKPSSLGDVVTTLPLLCDVFAAHPEAEIDWLIQPGLAALVENHDAVRRLIAFDRRKLGAWWCKPASFAALRRLLGELRGGSAGRYDVVIDAQGLLRSAFFAWASGAKVRIGFAHAREGAAALYTHRIALPEKGKKMFAVDRMRALGRALGTKPDRPAEFRLPVQPRAKKQAEKLLSAAGIRDGGFVAVLPGARWETKRWPAERYAEMIRRLVENGQRVVLLGSADERAICEAVLKLLGAPTAKTEARGGGLETRNSKLETPVNFAGQTDVAGMVAILARAAWVLGNDSGPLHVAAALGRPVVGIYGPTSPETVGPYGQLENVLRHDVPCHPCRRRHCGHHSCMNGLAVELVWEKSRPNAGLEPKTPEAAAKP